MNGADVLQGTASFNSLWCAQPRRYCVLYTARQLPDRRSRVTLLLCPCAENTTLEQIPRTTFANMSHQPEVTCISGGLALVSFDTGAIVRFPVFRLSHRVVALPTSRLPLAGPTVRYTERSSEGELFARD
jgi:hypothetical protein